MRECVGCGKKRENFKQDISRFIYPMWSCLRLTMRLAVASTAHASYEMVLHLPNVSTIEYDVLPRVSSASHGLECRRCVTYWLLDNDMVRE